MSIADRAGYLSDIAKVLRAHWPNNRAVKIVCHGHSVPAGYFATLMVDSFKSCMERSAKGDLSDILSRSNHSNRLGHECVTEELLRWFPAG